MRRQRDYSLIFLRILAMAVVVVVLLTVYWTIAARYPNVSVWGWLIVLAYMGTAVFIPTIVAPYLSNKLKIGAYLAWKISMVVWISSTAIIGLLARPVIGSYIEPFFIGASYVE